MDFMAPEEYSKSRPGGVMGFYNFKFYDNMTKRAFYFLHSTLYENNYSPSIPMIHKDSAVISTGRELSGVDMKMLLSFNFLKSIESVIDCEVFSE